MRARLRFVAPVFAVALGLFGCTDGDPDTGDSLTNWLVACTDDAQCDEACICGVCSRRCEDTVDCGGFTGDAVCTGLRAPSLEERCGSNPPPAGVTAICTNPCTADAECGDGRFCSDDRVCLGCLPGSCLNGGRCSPDGETCECPPGTQGDTCEIEDGVRQLALGTDHACALLSGGDIKCWGQNTSGELGLGDVEPRGDDPGEMGAALDVLDFGDAPPAVSVAAGRAHTCALFTDASLRCWGEGDDGRLGTEGTGDVGVTIGDLTRLPAIDFGGLRVRQVIAGNAHTCVLLEDGSVRCFGENAVGQLGVGGGPSRGDGPGEMGAALGAVELAPGGRVIEIVSLSNATCALRDDGTVNCWGAGNLGQLGSGNSEPIGDTPGELTMTPPLDFGPGLLVSDLTATGAFGCATMRDGSVKCWGYNGLGQLGVGDMTSRGLGPGQMGAMLPFLDVGGTIESLVAGGDIACARLDTGALKCWGQNGWGALGTGGNIGDDMGEVGAGIPALTLPGSVHPQGIAIGTGTICVIDRGENVYCWGRNDFGILGTGDSMRVGDMAGDIMNLDPLDLGLGAP